MAQSGPRKMAASNGDPERVKPWFLDDEHLAHRRAEVREFIEEPEYLGLGQSVFPEIARTLETVLCGDYDEAVLCWGIGSGKSFLASLALCYMAHSLLCLRDPQQSLGMAKGSDITFLVLAPSARQARDVVFAEVSRRIGDSPWFRQHAPSTEFLATEIKLPKCISVVAGNSSPIFPLGYNVLGGVIDEAAWFPVRSDRGEIVEDIYYALRRRISSRFMWRGLALLISSPRRADDFFDGRLQAASIEERCFGSRRATWDVRPSGQYSGDRFVHEGIEAPVEYLRDFEVNPQRALRDFGARPTSGLHSFFSDASVIDRCVRDAGRHPFDASGRLCSWFRATHDAPRYVHVDLGLTRDACGIAMAFCENDDGQAGHPRVVVELMHRIVAPAGGEIDLSRPREIILALRDRGFPIAQASYDGWQSADSKQILARRGIATKTVSVDRTPEAYETLKGLALDGRLLVYRYEPFLAEARLLEFTEIGKVDHPPGGSKDVADAVAGAVSEAVRNWRSTGVRAHVI